MPAIYRPWLCLLAAGLFSPACATAEDPISQSRRIISPHKAVFAAPPRRVPSFHTVDGPITGNGDLGLTQSGPPPRQRYWISKNDFWKSGPDFKQCGPSLIGGIDIEIDALKEASYRVEQALYEPVITSTFATPQTTVTIAARVLATENAILLELAADKTPVEVRVGLWAKDGYGSETAGGQDGDVRWVSRAFRGADLLFPSEAIVALRGLPASEPAAEKGNSSHSSAHASVPASEEAEQRRGSILARPKYNASSLFTVSAGISQRATVFSFPLEPGKPVTLLATVMTNHETADYQRLAQGKLRRWRPADLERLKQQHRCWWQGFWALAYVELDDKLLEKYYYAGHYIMACCSRNANFPPGLYGNWITLDRTAWSGDIHLNYNHEAPFWALYSSNRVALTDCYDAPLLDQLEGFRADARRYLNKRGAYASVAIGPKGLTCRFPDLAGLDRAYGHKCDRASYADLAGQPMFLGQKSNAMFAAMNMLLRYRYTDDRDYIAKVYPYLRAVADFWEDYLRWDGRRFVIDDDSVGEVGPWEGRNWKRGYGDFNPITSLGFLRVFLGEMIEISRDLGRDADKRDTWRRILDHLSDLPTAVEDGRRRFRACEGGTGSAAKIVGLDYIMLHSLVFPATNFGLGSDAATLNSIRDDMRAWPERTWLRHGNAFQSIFIAAPRVGLDPDFVMAKARAAIAARSDPNLWLTAGGGGIETCSGIPGMLNEMMLQSHGEVIRVFPAFPAGQNASFYRLRTFGAFLVSSAKRNGEIEYVTIESEKGHPCNLVNPWPGRAVRLSRNGGPAQELSGELLRLPSNVGETLRLTPAKSP